MNEIECIEIMFNFISTTGECNSHSLNEGGVTCIDEDNGKAVVYFVDGDVEYIYNVHHAIYREIK